ncbi:MAG: GntR family transcriptional regulator [Planctomycetes bacterium]|nr:GntR family transcriptional regulator [Planctomycetota bacterium]
MEFRINTASRLPIYQQLAHQIREGIARGKLREAERLPSVRELSQKLVVNPNTVARVYTELERDGVLYTRPGLGVFVAAPRAELTRKARHNRLSELLTKLLTEAVHLGFSADEVVEMVVEEAKRFRWDVAASR